jgi:hypothetical protein
MLCRAANSRYETERDKARKNGDWNGLVSAARARAHILELSRLGIGRKSVAAAASVSHTAVAEIRSGVKLRIRARTERQILAVDETVMSAGRLIPAGPTWKLIDYLITEGFTEAQLAHRLGYKTPKLQFSRTRITGKTAAAVRRLYERIEAI